MTKLLIIRFSSFGDIVHAVAVPRAFKETFPGSQVDWLTREDFAKLLEQQPTIDKVISFSRAAGVSGLIKLGWQLSKSGYTHIYDAHSNLRSGLLMAVLRTIDFIKWAGGETQTHFATRPKNRIRRFLFFKFRMNVLPRPFRAADSYHWPLAKWGLPKTVPQGPQFRVEDRPFPNDVEQDLAKARRLSHVIAIAPSAAWEMKRWPIEHWKSLIAKRPQDAFVILGGKEDTFVNELAAPNVFNFAGRLSLVESARLIARADLLVSNDTGSLQVGDQMERPTIALIGPTAFGYPSHSTSIALERPLVCQPCSKDGRGKCVNSLYKRCLIELTPDIVDAQIEAMLK